MMDGWTIQAQVYIEKNVIPRPQGEPIFIEEFLFFNGN
jgi:hypothetical protein